VEDLVFIATGFGIVMGVLASLWGVCAIVGRVFIRVETAKLATPEPAPAPQPLEGIPPAHVAAIAAAVASLSGSWRIARVDAPAHVSGAWAAQGRFEQQAKWQAHLSAAARLPIANSGNDGRGA
jgi:Na+-transporting methylmalonyl-CoA/oxaloacetate decarboxylase gamma subunit